MTDLPYFYGMLDPRVDTTLPADLRAAAEHHNAPLLGAHTLGIEVTVPRLAARCGLGNIDPQHGTSSANRAAVDLANRLALPPPTSTLVTIRPDADSLATMAVLTLRAQAIRLTPAALARIDAISACDRFARGPWPGPRPLPKSADEFDVDPRVGPIAGLAADAARPLVDRVHAIGQWLADGVEPAAYGDLLRSQRAMLLKRFEQGLDTVRLESQGRVAVVQSEALGVLDLGYRVAPVVIALNPAYGQPPNRKMTIAQYDRTHLDLMAVAKELRALEAGWGGSETIIGSPQGRGCALRLEKVIEVIVRHLDN